METCPECSSPDLSTAPVEQPVQMLDPTLGKTVEVPCTQTVHTCGGCGLEWTDYVGEGERDRACLHYWQLRAKELHEENVSLRSFKASVDEALNSGDGTYKP